MQQGITADLPRALARRGRRVVVLGDAILDGWLAGSCDRLCREAPAPVVAVHDRHTAPGGAANTATNLARLGADVRFGSVVGADTDGRQLLADLHRAGVDTSAIVVDEGRATLAKRRVVAGDQVLLRVDDGDTGPASEAADTELAHRVRLALADCDAVLVCDYAAGALGPPVRAVLRELRGELPLLVVDAHQVAGWAELRPDLVTPNAQEAAALLGDGLTGADRAEELADRVAELRRATGAAAVVVTLDRDGALLLTGDAPPYRTWASPAPDRQTAGAGDTFVAALTLAGAAGLPLTTGVELAQAAADVVVHRPGTAVCGTEELVRRLGSNRDAALSAAELARVADEHRAAGRRIVFTNGCFDVLHRGHVAYLNEAKRLGDVLVVAVNSDDSVRRLKGSDRPVNPAGDRAAVLAALSCVDHVAVFDADTPVELLERVRPDLYVKGGDYTPEMLPETPHVRAFGGEVRILGYLPDHSTSAVIEKIRATPVGDPR